MTLINIDVSAVGNYDAWTLTAGADKVAAVDYSGSHDDDTTRIQSATNAQRQSYTMDVLPSAASISNVDVIMRARDNNNGTETLKSFSRLSSTDSDYTDRTAAGGSAYTTWTDSGVARPGGGSWVPADFAATTVEFGVLKSNTGGGTAFVTSLYVPVTYTPTPGGYYFLLSCWLPPMMAAASHALTSLDIKRILARAKFKPTEDYEFDLLKREFQVRPRFVWLHH